MLLNLVKDARYNEHDLDDRIHFTRHFTQQTNSTVCIINSTEIGHATALRRNSFTKTHSEGGKSTSPC